MCDGIVLQARVTGGETESGGSERQVWGGGVFVTGAKAAAAAAAAAAEQQQQQQQHGSSAHTEQAPSKLRPCLLRVSQRQRRLRWRQRLWMQCRLSEVIRS